MKSFISTSLIVLSFGALSLQASTQSINSHLDTVDKVVYKLVSKAKQQDIIIKELQRKILLLEKKLQDLESDKPDISEYVRKDIKGFKGNRLLKNTGVSHNNLDTQDISNAEKSIKYPYCKTFSVKTYKANVRNMPNANAKIVAVKNEADNINFLDENNNIENGKWLEIEPYKYISIYNVFPNCNIKEYSVKVYKANLRTKPNGQKRYILKQLNKDTVVNIYPYLIHNSWYKTVDNNYIHKNTIKLVER